jgi:hypothetical protein
VEEIQMMREMRWWTAEEIEGAGERIFPVNLSERMRELWRPDRVNEG